MERILVIRFSALGDILMTIPVIDAVARAYPDTKITFLSRPYVSGILSLLPSNVSFMGVDLSSYKGLKGLDRLYNEVAKKVHPTCVCDLHDVLRTKYLRSRFLVDGIPVSHIAKGRISRRRFILAKEKTQQTPVFYRYADAFRKIGYGVTIDPTERFSLLEPQERNGIGIAPFAAHEGKTYPMEMMEEVVRRLSEHTEVYLFGAGDEERRITERWQEKYENVQSTVGRMGGMIEEMKLIGRLKVMLTMDSGNMHLASLVGTRVVSIWGATHPMGGFLGWGQNIEDVIQMPMKCRPCSTYGNRKCRMGSYPCLTGISPEVIADTVMKIIEN